MTSSPGRYATVGVLGTHLAYVECGPVQGRTLLFLHGNPTSSFLWRDVLAGLEDTHHCLALDLVGMGRSGKPRIRYDLADHARHLEAAVDALGLRDVVVVGHDWGAVLGLDLAHRRPDVVGAVAVCEGHLHPFAEWADLDEGSRELFGRLRTPGVGERMVVEENFFVEQVLPAGMARVLTAEETTAYRAPFLDPADRWPVLRWVQQIPIAGDPADVVATVLANQEVLLRGRLPRLLLHGEPGSVVGAAEVAWCRREGVGLTIASVGAGTHFLPEDQPSAIAAHLRSWLHQPGSPTG